MDNQTNLIAKIEKLRDIMHDLITKEGNLLHFKVIKVSQDLDKLLNEYNRIVGY